MLLETLGHMSLAPNQQLRLVRCGDDVLLLGVTSGQISLLKSYDSVEFAEANSIHDEGVASSLASTASEEVSFARLLQQQVGRSLTFKKSEVPC